EVMSSVFIGAQALLAPGFVWAAILVFRERRWDAGLLLLWWFALLATYAARLPLTYQHARYEMPVIPAELILGLWGSWRLSLLLPAGSMRRIISWTWLVAAGPLLALFRAVGAVGLAP